MSDTFWSSFITLSVLLFLFLWALLIDLLLRVKKRMVSTPEKLRRARDVHHSKYVDELNTQSPIKKTLGRTRSRVDILSE